MLPLKLALLTLLALILEAAAWRPLLLDNASAPDAALLSYLLTHAAASAALTVAALLLVPARLRRPRWPLALLVFGSSFALPVLGFIAALVGIALLRSLAAYKPQELFEPHELPKIDPHQRAGTGFRQSGLSSFLSNPAAPEASRLRALIALQSVSGRIAAPLLRNVLSDQSEDLRLLAYGMLDNHEKRINDEIHKERTRLAAAAEGSPPAITSIRKLAALYWELIYQELAQGDLRKHALAESLRFTELALAARANDAQMHLRRGRLLHLSGDAEAAAQAYDRALDLGLPIIRATPYLAELAFERGDHARVRTLMATLGHWRALPKLRPVVDFWHAEPKNARREFAR